MYPRVHGCTLVSKAPHGVRTLWRYLSNARALWYKYILSQQMTVAKQLADPEVKLFYQFVAYTMKRKPINKFNIAFQIHASLVVQMYVSCLECF